MSTNLQFCYKQHESYYLLKKYMPEAMANNSEANPIFSIGDVL